MKDPRDLTGQEVFLDAPDEALAAAAERILGASGFAVRQARAATVIEVDALRIDVARHEVRVADVPVPCTPTEFRVLQALAERAGAVVSYHVLLDRAWRVRRLDRDAYLRPIVSRLRRRLRDARAGAAGIETIRGVGYRLRVSRAVASVEEDGRTRRVTGTSLLSDRNLPARSLHDHSWRRESRQ